MEKRVNEASLYKKPDSQNHCKTRLLPDWTVNSISPKKEKKKDSCTEPTHTQSDITWMASVFLAAKIHETVILIAVTAVTSDKRKTAKVPDSERC